MGMSINWTVMAAFYVIFFFIGVWRAGDNFTVEGIENTHMPLEKRDYVGAAVVSIFVAAVLVIVGTTDLPLLVAIIVGTLFAITLFIYGFGGYILRDFARNRKENTDK